MKASAPAPDSTGPEQPVHVGIGLVVRDGRFLVRQRPPGGPMPGYWEFPGGKCEAGESPADAALRECREELGLEVRINRLRRVVNHRYAHAWVEMSFFDCEIREPFRDPDASTGFRWVGAAELSALTFPGANDPILEELARESATRQHV